MRLITASLFAAILWLSAGAPGSFAPYWLHLPSTTAAQGSKQRLDATGDPLPAGALLRLGTLRHRMRGGFDTRFQALADGKTALHANVREVRWLDRGTGRVIDSWPLLPGHKFCGCADDGGFAVFEHKKTITLWDLRKRKAIRAFASKGDLGDEIHARFAGDGAVVATSHGVNWNAGLLRVWDISTGRELWQEGNLGFVDRGIWPMGFLADGRTLVVHHWSNNRISLRDRMTGRELRSFDTMPRQGSRSFALSPDGKTVFVGTSGPEVKAWDVATGKELPPLGGHSTQAHSFAVSADSKIVLTAGSDRFIQVWDWPAGKLRRRIDMPRGISAPQMTVSGDGKRAEIVIWGEHAIRFFDLESGKEQPPLIEAHRGPVHGLAITADDQVVSAGTDNTIRLWDLRTGRHVREISTPHPLGASTMALSADGRLIATADFNRGAVALHERQTGRLLRTIETDRGRTHHVAFAPAGRLLAVVGEKSRAGPGSGDGFVALHDADSGKELRRLEGFASVFFVADDKTLLWYGQDQARVVDVTSGRIRFALPRQEMRAVAVSPDGRMLACGDQKEITLWELATAQQRGRINTPGGYPRVLRFSPDGRWLAQGDHERVVHLYDILGARIIHTYAGHDSTVYCLEFSPDGRSLASASHDSTVLIWDVAEVMAQRAKPVKVAEVTQIAAAWNDLGSADVKKAYRAMTIMIEAPTQSLPLLREKLRPASGPDKKQVERLLAKLEHPQFAEREQATRELERLGDDIEPALERYLAGKNSLEARRRVEVIFERVQGPLTDRAKLQQLRALEVLEMIGSSKARMILAHLAGGPPDARISREARAAAARLRKDTDVSNNSPPVYITNTGYHATWQPFVNKLATLTAIERGKGPELPERLDQRRLVLISGDVKLYSKDRTRLLKYVDQGGTLLFWFIDDERNDPDFFPFKLKNTNDDAGVLTFTKDEHPLLEGLRGKTIKNGEQGGDVVRDWDKARWTVLADTPAGPAMLVGKHGRGHILICQFSTGFAKQIAIHERLAVNLAVWLKLPKRR